MKGTNRSSGLSGRAAITRRALSIAIMVALFGTSVPPAAAASTARETVSLAQAGTTALFADVLTGAETALVSAQNLGLLGQVLLHWFRLLGISPGAGAPLATRDSRGQKPRPQESKADREARVSSLRINPSGKVELTSQQPMLFTAIPIDAEGTPVQGLHAEWQSSDTQIVFIKKTGEAMAGKPGQATLVTRAGSISATVAVTVSEGTGERFGGKKKESSNQTLKRQTDQSIVVKNGTTVAKRHHTAEVGTRSNNSPVKSVLTLSPAPLREPNENPLPDDETNSLYLPANAVGSPSGKTKPGANVAAVATVGTENGDQNYSFALPIVGTSGRGLGVSLSLVYNSQLWNKSTAFNNSTRMTYDVDSGWPAPGFRIGFGQIENQGSYGLTLTDRDGTRHALTYTSAFNYDTKDGSFIHYSGGTGYGTLFYPDGTIVYYGAGGGGYRIYPTRVIDPNGNYIDISYAGTNGVGPKISSITDTLDRHIIFYYASNGDLVTITAPGLSGESEMMRFYYADVTLGASLFGSGISVNGPATIHTLESIYLPASSDGTDARTGYKFNYSAYGMIGQITKSRGMAVSSTSFSSPGSVTSDGTLAVQTTYNYSATGLSLTDVPKYSERSDEWAGRTSAGSAPVYTFANSQGTNEKISTVTAPDGTVTEAHTKDAAGQWDDGLVQQITVMFGTATLSKTVMDWEQTPGSGPPRLASVRVTDDGSTPRTKATVFSYTSYNNVSAMSERDFTTDGSVSGTEVRRTETSYITSSNYINRHLLRLPDTIKVFPGGSSTPAGRVDYAYDNYGSSHANLTARDDIIMHDPSYDPFAPLVENCYWDYSGEFPVWTCDYYSPYDPATDYRGNVTAVTTYPDATSSSGTIIHSTTYDIAGNVMTSQVDCCQLKSFTYSGAGTNGTHDYAYVISLTTGNPAGLHLTTSATYDYDTGLLASSTDENNQVTTNYYNSDSFRSHHITYPDGGATYFTYSDALSADANGEYHFYAESATKLDGSGGSTRYLTDRSYYDGRGMVARTMSNHTTANGWSTQDVEYNSMGQAFRASNPYFAANDTVAINSAGYWTTRSFDHLGRVTSVTMPTGDSSPSSTTSVTATSDGIFTTVTDQANKLRRQKVDALGRVVRSDEPNSSNSLGDYNSPNQPTYYNYDVLDNLVQVSQTDQSSVTQNRYFKYDSLSRLIRERQVEQETNSNYNLSDPLNSSWTRKLEYNSSGLVTNAYDARGVVTTFAYDDLNRLQTISYSDSTPTAHYFYDSQNLPSGAPTASAPDSYSRGYSNGRLVAMTSGSGATGTYFGYDVMGNVTTQFQLTGAAPAKYKLSYAYNSAGILTSETYPSNRTLTYAYDDGGRLLSIGDGATTFASSFAYEAHGGLASETFGNAMVHALEYNKRLQANKVKLSQTVSGTTTVLQQSDYHYGQFNSSTGNVDSSKNNGKVGSITGTINGTTQWLQGFSYDEVGRLSNVKEFQSADTNSQTYSQSYTYDRFGNRFQSANSTLNVSAISSSEINAATNRFINTGSTPTTYDAAGNIKQDTKFRGLKYDYDANGRQTTVKLADDSVIQSAIYDCTGRRVQTTAGGVTRASVYDVFGQQVADYLGSTGSTLERENIYRGGQLLAVVEINSGTAPSEMTATVSASSVTLNWSAGVGATNYRVERKGAGVEYSSIATTSSTTLVDSGAGATSAYLYRVCAANGAGACISGYSNVVLGARLNFSTDATITTMGDDPSGATVTSMKAAHITELRTAVNAVRSLAGLGNATWTHPGLATGDVIYKEDVSDLRTKLNEALTTLGLRISTYIDDPMTGGSNGTLIRGIQIKQLRQCTTSGGSCYKPIPQFVKDMYQGILHRQPTQQELSDRTSTLAVAQSQGQSQLIAAAQSLATALSNSSEYASLSTSNAQFEIDLYSGFLQRTYDLSGYAYWLDQINNHGDTRAHQILAFALSGEFLANVSALCSAPAAGGGLRYILSDLQGSTRAVMNNYGASSAVVARHDYLPFGEEIGSGLGLRNGNQGFGASDTNRTKYGLAERDITGLDHTLFRKYESLSGRWTSPDPYMGSANIAQPQSFNRYAYVQNDPVNFVDPSGLIRVCYYDYFYTHYQGTAPDGTPIEGTRINLFVSCFDFDTFRFVPRDPEPRGGFDFMPPRRPAAPKAPAVEKCARPAELKMLGIDWNVLGFQHTWIRTPTNEAGAGPAGGGVPGQGGSNSPYKTQMTMNSHAGQGDKEGANCTTVPNVNLDKVNAQLELGRPLGRFHLLNNCQTVVASIIRNATPPEPRPTDPLTKLPVGTQPVSSCPYPQHP